jgi:hypothetical protein
MPSQHQPITLTFRVLNIYYVYQSHPSSFFGHKDILEIDYFMLKFEGGEFSCFNHTLNSPTQMLNISFGNNLHTFLGQY